MVILCFTLIDPYIARSQFMKIVVSYSADTPANLPGFTVKETGLFSKNGLDVQLVRIARNVAVMGLISGESPISQVGGAAKTVPDMISDAKAAKVKPEQFVDLRFVNELDDTGYIDNLYKRVSKDRRTVGSILEEEV
jgi:hypothetical protein